MEDMKGMDKPMKIVFTDGNVEKVVRGKAEFIDDFLKVISEDTGKEVYIQKSHIVFMREL